MLLARIPSIGLPLLAVALLVAGSVPAQAQKKLLAPGYPGAQAAGQADAGEVTAAWLYLTRDPIAKVKAFYESNVGAFTYSSGNHFFTPLASEDTKGAMFFVGVRVTGPTPAAKIAGMSDSQLQAWALKSRNFADLAQYVSWVNMGGQVPGFHPVKEFRDVVAKYGYVSGLNFPAGKEGKSDDMKLREEYKERSRAMHENVERQRGAAMEQQVQGMMDKMQRGRAGEDVRSPQERQRQNQEDAELNAMLERKPKLKQQIYADSQEMNNAMNAGDYRAAKVATDKMQAHMRSDPEVAAYLDKREAEAKKRNQEQRAANTTKMAQDQQQQSAAADSYGWKLWIEYLQELDKRGYPVAIEIGEVKGRNAETNRDKVLVLWKKFGEAQARSEDEQLAKQDTGDDSGSGGGRKRGNAAPMSDSDGPAAGQKPTAGPASRPKEPEKKEPGINKDDAIKAGKEGLNLIKKLF